VIVRHLAHGSDEELGSAYDCATFLNQRRKMIQCGRICSMTWLRTRVGDACLRGVRGSKREEMSVEEADSVAGALPILMPDFESCVEDMLGPLKVL